LQFNDFCNVMQEKTLRIQKNILSTRISLQNLEDSKFYRQSSKKISSMFILKKRIFIYKKYNTK